MLHEGSCFIEFIKRVEEKRYTILLLFRNEFNKFNNTGAQMFVSIYHMIFKLHKIAFFGVNTSICCSLLLNFIMDVIT